MKRLEIRNVKSLRSFNISFKEVGLTAILGVNGSGKSTILHLLACAYHPQSSVQEASSQDYRFPMFFIPVRYSYSNSQFSWQGTSFTYHYSDDRTLYVDKRSDRWMNYMKRRTPVRPARWVSYLGIDTCVPDIEKEKRRSPIIYGESVSVRNSSAVRNDAAYILGKRYSSYKHVSRFDGKNNAFVEVEGRASYTSLSMGAGEQRVFRILEEVHRAPQKGLILIDEIDLLLHQSSLERLLKKLTEIAREREL